MPIPGRVIPVIVFDKSQVRPLQSTELVHAVAVLVKSQSTGKPVKLAFMPKRAASSVEVMAKAASQPMVINNNVRTDVRKIFFIASPSLNMLFTENHLK